MTAAAESPYWPKPARDPEVRDPMVVIDGNELIKIDGTWCAQTLVGTWRPVPWLGAFTVGHLLDRIYRLTTSEASP